MASKIGTDAARALSLLSRATHAAWTPAKIAVEVGCTDRSVYRWRSGQHQPSTRNREALVTLIQALINTDHHGPYRLSARQQVLIQAREALTTDAERARSAEILADLRARAAQAEADAEEDLEAQRVARQARERRRSVTAQADPFALIDSARPREVAMF